MALSEINWEHFYQQGHPEEIFQIINSNVVDCIKKCSPLKTIYICNDNLKINLKDHNLYFTTIHFKKTTATKMENHKRY